MYNKFFIASLLLFSTFATWSIANQPHDELYDVTVLGCIRFSNGIARNTIAVLDYLQDSVTMNHINTRPEYSSYDDVPLRVRNLIEKNNHSPSNVAILYEGLKMPGETQYDKVPNSKIKLTYGMVESTKIPKAWTPIINDHFDAVVVPDEWLVEVYKSSGVQKPIFVLPHPIYIDEFLAQPLKKGRPSKFTFGLTALLSPNKNVETLVDAFIAEFGRNRKVQLKIQTMAGKDDPILRRIYKKLKKRKVKNVHINITPLPWSAYVEFIKSLDCYTLVSKGEGFSVTPREALACGIPCVISNQTAQKTICNTGLVYGVPANVIEPHSGHGYGEVCGNSFACRVEDVRKGLREVYNNYDYWLAKAHQGREWVKQYHGNNLKPRYVNLFKPRQVILGDENKITNEYLMTTDKALYDKYISLQKTASN